MEVRKAIISNDILFIYLFIYLLTNAHKNQKHNASNVKIHAIDELQERPFIAANSNPLNLNTT